MQSILSVEGVHQDKDPSSRSSSLSSGFTTLNKFSPFVSLTSPHSKHTLHFKKLLSDDKLILKFKPEFPNDSLLIVTAEAYSHEVELDRKECAEERDSWRREPPGESPSGGVHICAPSATRGRERGGLPAHVICGDHRPHTTVKLCTSLGRTTQF